MILHQTSLQSQILRWEEKNACGFSPKRAFYIRIGIGQKRFGLIRVGKASPTLEEMKKLAEFFDVSTSEFL